MINMKIRNNSVIFLLRGRYSERKKPQKSIDYR